MKVILVIGGLSCAVGLACLIGNFIAAGKAYVGEYRKRK
jgi:hypothetical protein